MKSQELTKLMISYARRGIDDWSQANNDLKSKAGQFLSMASIIDRETDAENLIRRGSSSTNRREFIPMPELKNRGFERAFFDPEMANGVLTKLTLFLLVNRARRKGVGFRFECSSARSRHNYTHVQLVHRIPVSGQWIRLTPVPEWLPESYPAIPIFATTSLELFFLMVTAVHGFGDGGSEDVIRELCQEASLSNRVGHYQATLKSLLPSLSGRV